MRQRRSDAQSVADVEEQKGMLPMSHTPEPWTHNHHAIDGSSLDNANSSIELARFKSRFNAQRAVDCVNGCAGLNPAAYRACIGVLKAVVSGQVPSQEVYVRAKEALARATGGQP